MSTKVIAIPPIHPPFHRSYLEESKEALATKSPAAEQFELELERVKEELAQGTMGKSLAQRRKEKREDLMIELDIQNILDAMHTGREDLLDPKDQSGEAACARELNRPAKPKKTNSRALSVGHGDFAAKKKAGRQTSLSLGRKREEDDEEEQLHLTFMQKLQIRLERFKKHEKDGTASPTSISSAASETSSRSPSSLASSVESAISPRSSSPASLPSTSESGASSRSASPSLKTRLLTAFRAFTSTRRAGIPTSAGRPPSAHLAPLKERPGASS